MPSGIEQAIRSRLRELARIRPRYGYRRMTALLRTEGFSVNHRRIQRICRDEGLRVLRGAKKPLTAGEITDIALRRGLLRTHGKTPAATMSAALYGAPEDSPIHRAFAPGRQRAVRDSVRWTYDKRAR